MKVLMLHGINHNMFGKRDPKQYGTITLAQIDDRITSYNVCYTKLLRLPRSAALLRQRHRQGFNH